MSLFDLAQRYHFPAPDVPCPASPQLRDKPLGTSCSLAVAPTQLMAKQRSPVRWHIELCLGAVCETSAEVFVETLCKKICAHPYIAEHLNKALPGIVLQTSKSSTKPSKHPTRHHPPAILHQLRLLPEKQSAAAVVQTAAASLFSVNRAHNTRTKALTADCAYMFPISFSLRLQLFFLDPSSRFSQSAVRSSSKSYSTPSKRSFFQPFAVHHQVSAQRQYLHNATGTHYQHLHTFAQFQSLFFETCALDKARPYL